MRALLFAPLLMLALAGPAFAEKPMVARKSTAAQIDYSGFRSLADDVAAYRQTRLIDFAQFTAMANTPGVIVLDARSSTNYARGHLKGAINLPFTEFTAESLQAALGDPDVKILIYCNNNFANDRAPVVLKSAPLALNIPTFINLVGYGYRNVYELGEVIDFNDPAVEWVTAP